MKTFCFVIDSSSSNISSLSLEGKSHLQSSIPVLDRNLKTKSLDDPSQRDTLSFTPGASGGHMQMHSFIFLLNYFKKNWSPEEPKDNKASFNRAPTESQKS